MFSVDVRKIAAPNTLQKKYHKRECNYYLLFKSNVVLRCNLKDNFSTAHQVTKSQIIVNLPYWQKG